MDMYIYPAFSGMQFALFVFMYQYHLTAIYTQD